MSKRDCSSLSFEELIAVMFECEMLQCAPVLRRHAHDAVAGGADKLDCQLKQLVGSQLCDNLQYDHESVAGYE